MIATKFGLVPGDGYGGSVIGSATYVRGPAGAERYAAAGVAVRGAPPSRTLETCFVAKPGRGGADGAESGRCVGGGRARDARARGHA